MPLDPMAEPTPHPACSGAGEVRWLQEVSDQSSQSIGIARGSGGPLPSRKGGLTDPCQAEARGNVASRGTRLSRGSPSVSFRNWMEGPAFAKATAGRATARHSA